MTALTVSTMSGRCVFTADGGAFETVGDVKRAIQNEHGLLRFQQRLVLQERALEDDVALSTLGQAPLRCSLISLPYREDEATAQAVVQAILQDDINALERALRLPANPDGPTILARDQWPPLYHATMLGCPEMVALLLEAATDPTVPVHNHNHNGAATTCLEIALENACADVVRQLARRGTNLDHSTPEG